MKRLTQSPDATLAGLVLLGFGWLLSMLQRKARREAWKLFN